MTNYHFAFLLMLITFVAFGSYGHHQSAGKTTTERLGYATGKFLVDILLAGASIALFVGARELWR